MAEALAHFGGRLATGLVEVVDEPAALDRGWWAVVAGFEGEFLAAQFADVRPAPLPTRPWPGIHRDDWTSSLGQDGYVAAVEEVRARIAAGDVYQVNVCRVLSAPLPSGADLVGLAGLLAAGNPAPHQGVLRLPDHDLQVATASPELFLRRDGRTVVSGPIKGTGRVAADLLPKDRAENVMIVDLVRNDLGAVCETGTVEVPDLMALEEHPGLVHLVSRVRGRLRGDVGWPELLAATFPPGSVSGAPKSSALRAIDDLEHTPRDVYCGAVGWVDVDAGTAELAVAIRTFWASAGVIRFGTGAGITWGSDPYGEWAETELKAERLLAVAAQEVHA